MNQKQKFIIYFIIFLVIVFITEIFYRKPLYKLSVKYIKTIKQIGFFHNFYSFWAIFFIRITNYSGIIITILFYPINIFFCHSSIIIILRFLNGLLKSLYVQERPFWDIFKNYPQDIFLNPSGKPTECITGFGNPSGHAMSSTYLLFLWHLIVNSSLFQKIEVKKRNIIKYITLGVSILFIIFVLYSRINRQVHSFNQIIFGTLIGVSIFIFLCYIVDINKISSEKFIEILEKYKYYVIPIFILLFFLSIIFKLTIRNGNEGDYSIILAKYCSKNQNPEEIFSKSNPYISSNIFTVIGGYLGLLFLKKEIKKNYPFKEERFYNWNKGGKMQTFKILICNFLLSYIHLYIPTPKNYSFNLIFNLIMNFLVGFLAFGFYFYYACDIFVTENVIDKQLLLLSEEYEKENENSIN